MVRVGFGHIFRWRSILKSRRVASLSVLCLLAANLQVPAASAASVFKCQGEQGVPMYQEFPCPPGKELRNFERDPPPLTVVPGGAALPSVSEATRNARSSKSKSTAPAKAERSTKPQRDATERRHAHSGMTEGEVLAKLGRPDITASGGARKGKGRWTYLPAPGDPDTITTLQMDHGVVMDVERKVVKR